MPTPDAVADALAARTGLTVERSHDTDGNLESVKLPLIRESLFDWQIEADRIQVRSFIPAHPYLWARLNAVMTEAGGRIGDVPYAWHPDSDIVLLDRRWSELSRRQRFILRLPTIGAWRPLDFLAEREG